MSNVIAFRHSATSSAHVSAWSGLRRSSHTRLRAAEPRRQILVAEWRINAANGRLECRWRSEGSERRDEDGSRRPRRRHAA